MAALTSDGMQIVKLYQDKLNLFREDMDNELKDLKNIIPMVKSIKILAIISIIISMGACIIGIFF